MALTLAPSCHAAGLHGRRLGAPSQSPHGVFQRRLMAHGGALLGLGCRHPLTISSVAARASGGNEDRNTSRDSNDPSSKEPIEFGHTRKDVVLIGVGLIGVGYAMYYGLQALGLDAGSAGNWVQLSVFLGICVFWIGSYIWRVGTKNMTYAKQLSDYEAAVMQKRFEELPEAEIQSILKEQEGSKNSGPLSSQ
ncbi:CPLD38 [Auxenochlorella protothecoides x Auxenochlorella symbiontica]